MYINPVVIVNYWILYYHDEHSMAIDTINRIVIIYDDILSISRRLNSKIILQEATEKKFLTSCSVLAIMSK